MVVYLFLYHKMQPNAITIMQLMYSFSASDVFNQTNTGLLTEYRITGLNLSNGRRYFFKVTAFNSVGLHTSLYSDGFIVDTDNPKSGVVYNTYRHRNVGFQSSLTTFSLSWHGFQDHSSGIKMYFAGLIDGFNNDTIKTFASCGLQTSVRFTGLKLHDGQQVLGVVKAVDVANHESQIVYSKQKMVDSTPPLAYICRDKTVVYGEPPIKQGPTSVSLSMDMLTNMVYTISGKLYTNETYHTIRIRVGENRGQVVPLHTVHGGAFKFKYTFHSEMQGNYTIIVDSVDTTGIIQDVAVSQCAMSPSSDKSHALYVKQISAHTIQIGVRVFDAESTVKRVSIVSCYSCYCFINTSFLLL